MKRDKIQPARELRLQGKSYKAIAVELGISPSTSQRWTGDIVLSQEKTQELLLLPGRLGNAVTTQRAQSVRLQYQEIGSRDCGSINMHLAGCMLYWAEGTKNRNVVEFCNYDPEMVAFFLRFLRECYPHDLNTMTIRVACYDQAKVSENEEWWLRHLDLPRSALRKGTLITKKGKKNTVHIRGGCRLSVFSTELKQRILGSIKQYAGLGKDKWL